MKPLAETLIGPPNLTTLPGVRPLGDVLIPAGAGRVVVVKDGTLNRAGVIDNPAVFSDYNRSNPPEPAALAIVAHAIRNRARNEIGPGAAHTILDLEARPRQTLRQQVDALAELRKGIGQTVDASIFEFPQAWEGDEAFADAAAAVTCPVVQIYPFNEVIRHGLPAWLKLIDDSAAMLKRLMPRRRRKVAFVCSAFQVFWNETDILDRDGEPVPLDWWRTVNERLRDGGWETVWFEYSPPMPVEHIDVFAEIWGLMRTVPAVEVA